MNKEEVKKLAELGRVAFSDAELDKMALEIDSILHYVNQIKNASGGESDNADSRIESASVRNVMRTDYHGHEGGRFSKRLIESAPEHKDQYIKVKKITGSNEVN